MSAVGLRGVRGGGGRSMTRPPAEPSGMRSWCCVLGDAGLLPPSPLAVSAPSLFGFGFEFVVEEEEEEDVVSRCGFESVWDRDIKKKTMRMKTAATMARRELIMAECCEAVEFEGIGFAHLLSGPWTDGGRKSLLRRGKSQGTLERRWETSWRHRL